MSEKKRADVALVERGLAESREKAQAMIMAGAVYVREVKVLKASEQVLPEDELLVRGQPHPYVGRGALKLEKALRCFRADVRGCVALDIGAATGGFTDVLLQSGAKHVYAIDVGYGQLDWKIRNHPDVTVMERTNARYLTPESIPLQPTVTVMDVSFISVKLILPVAAELMRRRGVFYILIKPQFEAGRENVGKKGVVREPKVHDAVVRGIVDFAPTFGYRVTQLSFSPIKGPEGNIEYLAEIRPEADAGSFSPLAPEAIRAVVADAHAALDQSAIE